jgi:hypothetical protein
MSGRVEFQTGAVRGLDVGCTTVPIGDPASGLFAIEADRSPTSFD